MMKICAMIIILLVAAPLGDAARIFGFKPFSLNSDSPVKATPASSYPPVEERTPEKAFLELNECFSRRANLEKHPGSEAALGDAARIFCFKTFCPNSDSQVKATPASSYPSVEERTPENAFLELNECFSRRANLEKHPGSEVPLGDAARIFGFKPFSLNSDSQVKATPASSYPSVEERTPENAFLELNECFSRRANLEKHPGSEAPLGDAARIVGFKPFSLNSDSPVKATPASSYPSVEERTPEKAFLELNECLSRRANLEKHPGSEGKLKPNVSAKSKASDQRSDEIQAILASLKFNVVEHAEEKYVVGHSPRIGHDNPPSPEKYVVGHSPRIGHDNPPSPGTK